MPWHVIRKEDFSYYKDKIDRPIDPGDQCMTKGINADSLW